ncbi:MAG: TatD family hydrolase, partial [bacterium]|nr:TatD family hydrolase [bacterium]
FLKQAKEKNKIINIHTKGAEEEVLDLLKKYDLPRVIVHWYSGPSDILDRYIDYGAFLTVGVELLFSEYIQELALKIPEHLLLTETDNPGGFRWLTKKDGMPSVIKQIVSKLAEIKELKTENIERAVLTNFIRLTRNDPNLSEIYQTLIDELMK